MCMWDPTGMWGCRMVAEPAGARLLSVTWSAALGVLNLEFDAVPAEPYPEFGDAHVEDQSGEVQLVFSGVNPPNGLQLEPFNPLNLPGTLVIDRIANFHFANGLPLIDEGPYPIVEA